MKKNPTKKTDTKVIDAKGRTLGRLASESASILMGKDKASFERNKYSGSSLKIMNASKLRISPKKLSEIYHTRYSGSPGGLRVTTATETAKKKGLSELIKLAIYHMLPSNKLRREMMKGLTVEE